MRQIIKRTLEQRIAKLEKAIKNEKHGASKDLIKLCREIAYPAIDKITQMISSDFPTYDDPSYDEYSGLRNAMLDLRSAANHVIYKIDELHDIYQYRKDRLN